MSLRERLIALLEAATDDELALMWREGDAQEFDSIYGRQFKALISVWTP